MSSTFQPHSREAAFYWRKRDRASRMFGVAHICCAGSRLVKSDDAETGASLCLSLAKTLFAPKNTSVPGHNGGNTEFI
jgi:hypothetical protein